MSVFDEIRAAVAADPGPVAIDTETTSYDDLWRGLELRGVSIGVGGRAWYLPVSHPHSENLPARAVRDLLWSLIPKFGERRLFCWANAKYDWSVLLSTLGISMHAYAPDHWDVLVGGWLEDENIEIRDLKGRATMLFGPEASEPEREMRRACAGPTLAALEDEHFYGPGGRPEGGPRRPMGVTRAVAHEQALVDPRYGAREMWELTADEMAPYARQDAALTLDLHRYQSSLGPSYPIGLAMPREMDVARVLLGMEEAGIKVDAGAAEAAHARAVARLEALAGRFCGINPNSHDQLAKLVFGDWGFPVLERSTKTGEPSARREVLELLGDDPRITGLLEWRRLTKAVTAYYRPLLDRLDGNDRIHPTFNQAKVRTGRFSAERPNLQQIPREDTNSEIRAIFTAEPGLELVSFDLRQAEVRVAAALSREEALLGALRVGRDIYEEVAAALSVPRRIAKEVVLADSYGAGGRRLASSINKGTGRAVTPADVVRAEALQYRLARAYPRLAWAAVRAADIARSEGRLPLPPPGRYRHFRGHGHPPEAYHKAWNSACQGGVGEQVKQLMVELDKAGMWKEFGARLLLQIHDELVAEVPPGEAERLGKAMQAVLDDCSYFPAVRLPLEVKYWRRR